MSPLLDVSDDVRAEIGDDEADRLLAGENAPGAYDCTSCRTPGDTGRMPTTAVLFVGEETAVLAFAHAACIPSQVVKVSEEQVQGAVRTITAEAGAAGTAGAAAADPGYGYGADPAAGHGGGYGYAPGPGQGFGSAPGPGQQFGSVPGQATHYGDGYRDGYGGGYGYQEGVPAPAGYAAAPSGHPGRQAPDAYGTPGGTAGAGAVPRPASPGSPAFPAAPGRPSPERAVLSVTCGQVLIERTVHAAVVVEPTSRIARPGTSGPGDDFLPLLAEQGFQHVTGLGEPPAPVSGWSVLVAMGQLHAILQPPSGGTGQPTAWWQAHQALPVTEEWRESANRNGTVLVYAAPTGSIGHQPREDLLREALVQAAARGVLVAATMPLQG
ncbi:hypothetical protein H181DRAFT_04967 [Streptomyces sp. WMMB 714]|nr:hypothetical protein H181DRAFT_04967 [Streptomyces sp. WMMB 714]